MGDAPRKIMAGSKMPDATRLEPARALRPTKRTHRSPMLRRIEARRGCPAPYREEHRCSARYAQEVEAGRGTIDWTDSD